ncbi:tRNA (N6-threonylcarbamoyladenosine(37)-N6)-methyltransferase TrmO [bacterium]|nr:tRNA (N6-threonylcarbamoyladenosine(37)-N6)-methyltransferase TrmO [bacterium]
MIKIQSIGIIHSPHKELKNMPIQPKGAAGIEGKIIVDKEYAEGLKDLDGFSHIFLIYHFHKTFRTELIVTPFMDDTERGVFSTRTPMRPNHIGISIVELLKVEKNIITVSGIDILDGTPLLDIKPYIENFDHQDNCKTGWMKGSAEDVKNRRSDERFV